MGKRLRKAQEHLEARRKAWEAAKAKSTHAGHFGSAPGSMKTRGKRK